MRIEPLTCAIGAELIDVNLADAVQFRAFGFLIPAGVYVSRNFKWSMWPADSCTGCSNFSFT